MKNTLLIIGVVAIFFAGFFTERKFSSNEIIESIDTITVLKTDSFIIKKMIPKYVDRVKVETVWDSIIKYEYIDSNIDSFAIYKAIAAKYYAINHFDSTFTYSDSLSAQLTSKISRNVIHAMNLKFNYVENVIKKTKEIKPTWHLFIGGSIATDGNSSLGLMFQPKNNDLLFGLGIQPYMLLPDNSTSNRAIINASFYFRLR